MSGFLAILQEVLMFVFDGILKPVLIEVAKFIVRTLIDIIVDVLGWVFYFVWTTLLQVIAQLATAFEFFAGTSKGLVNNGQNTVLGVMFSLDFVSQMFAVFTGVGLCLAFIFSIINVIKSMSDMTLENKNPISKVLSNAAKSMVTFAIIPLLCLFMLKLSNIVIDEIDYAADASNGATIDRIIWYNCSLNASKNDELNLNGEKTSNDTKQKILSGTESTRRKFYKPAAGEKLLSYAYNDVEEMSSKDFNFNYGKFDYGLGFAAAIAMIFVLVSCVMVFVARIFEIIALYLVGPLFAATIANDGGEMFKQWKDMFVAKFLGGYGMVLGMRLYLIIIPYIMSGRIQFTTSNIEGIDGKFNAFIQLLFLVGGAYAVFKSQILILRLLSIEAASQAEASAAMARSVATAVGSMGASTYIQPIKALGAGYIQGSGEKDKKNAEGEKEKKDAKDSSSSFSSGSSGSGNMYRGGRPE